MRGPEGHRKTQGAPCATCPALRAATLPWGIAGPATILSRCPSATPWRLRTKPNRTETPPPLSLSLALSLALCLRVSLPLALWGWVAKSATLLMLLLWRRSSACKCGATSCFYYQSCDGGPSPAPSRGISTPLINPHLILTHSQEVLQTFLRLPDLMTSLILRNSLSLGKTSTAWLSTSSASPFRFLPPWSKFNNSQIHSQNFCNDFYFFFPPPKLTSD